MGWRALSFSLCCPSVAHVTLVVVALQDRTGVCVCMSVCVCVCTCKQPHPVFMSGFVRVCAINYALGV